MGGIMREIKFRCWHKGYDYPEVKKPIAPKMFYDDKPGDCLNYLAMGQPVEIMQFTGLHDKNGKEIWEGDVLAGFGGFKTVVRHGITAGYHAATINVGFYLENGGRDYAFSSEHGRIEVLGNIYENPDLLPTPQTLNGKEA